MTTQVFGSSIRRREDPRLITGRGTYVDDIKLVGMLHMVLVRSPHAHAIITGIDTSATKDAPGVVAVYTGEELKDQLGSLPCGWVVPDTKEVPHPPIALGRVRCVGEAVATVIATDPALAADAAQLVEVDYDPLPVVVNAEEAAKSGAPQLHEDAPDNIAFEWEVAGGDIDKAAAEAEVVVKQRLINQRLIPNSMEARGVVADFNPGTNQLTVWTSSQIPHLVRLLMSMVTGHPEHQLRIIVPEVGGAFGSKLYLYAEEIITAMVAKQLGRPVKWIEGRQENYLATTHGRDHITDAEVMGNRDGTITGLKVTCHANLGAYLSTFAPLIPTWYFGLMLNGPYETPNIYCKTIGVFTNTTPVDAYRGAGRPEATYLIERMVDMFAAEIGMDPLEVRRKNLIPPFTDGHAVTTGVSYDSGNYQASLDRALEIVGYQQFRREQEQARSEGRYLGIGLSTYVEISGAAPSAVAGTLGARAPLWESALVRVHPTGTVKVYTGSSAHDIVHGDTDQVPFGPGTFGSRSVAVGGGAINLSVEKIKDKARKVAAHLMEAAEADIVYEDGKLFVRGAPANAKTFQEVALASYYYTENLPEGMEPGLEATSFFDPSNFTWPAGTHIAVVEVDPDTGQVTLKRFVAVDDVGNVINPMIVDGMVHGGIAQGVGQALQEAAVYDESGQLLSGSMMDYAVPTAEDFPSFEVERTVTPSPVNAMGVKGAGETGTIAASPAVINAVVDALSPLGIKHIDMPAKPENVWRRIDESRPR